MIFLIYLPALAALLWTVLIKWRQARMRDVAVFVACGVIIFVNIFIVNLRWQDDALPTSLTIVQQLLSVLIIPIIYLYFAEQVLAKWSSTVLMLMASYMLLFLVPATCFYLDGQPAQDWTFSWWTCSLILHGQVWSCMNTADVIILLQGVTVLVRILSLISVVRHYDIKLSGNIKYFFLWALWGVALAVYASVHDREYFANGSLHAWYYNLSFSVLITLIFVLLALDLNLRSYVELKPEVPDDDTAPSEEELQSEQNVVIQDVVGYVTQSREMALKLRQQLDAEQIYLRPGITAKDAIALLGTNRTYFARMMKVEFGCTFADVVNARRIEHSKQLMLSTDKTLSAIAEECGFRDLSTFSERFKTIEGVSPSAWRKN